MSYAEKERFFFNLRAAEVFQRLSPFLDMITDPVNTQTQLIWWEAQGLKGKLVGCTEGGALVKEANRRDEFRGGEMQVATRKPLDKKYKK